MLSENHAISSGVKYITVALLLSAVCLGIGCSSLLFERRYDSVPADNGWDAESVLVVLDAGHGGEDGGCVGADGTYEKDLNLAVTLRIYEMLSAMGIRCVLTRSSDMLLYDLYGELSDYDGVKKVYDLKNRVKYAEEFENAVFISIHMNTFSRSEYSGLQVWYSKNSEGSSRLADMVASYGKSYLQRENDRATKQADSSIYVLDRIKIPAVLIECGFLSNTDECARLSDEEYQGALALTIASAVTEYLSERGK